jgi:AcrR family transcriptional regulator
MAAAMELVHESSYQKLSVGEIMERAGFERTLFYRHFDDLGELLRLAGREAMLGLYNTELDLDVSSEGLVRETVRAAMEPAVMAYHEHGPLLRTLAEAAAAGDEAIAEGHEMMHRRFDELVVDALRGFPKFADAPESDLKETARALNLMNTAYLLDAFGRPEPRISIETALVTVTEIWVAVIGDVPNDGGS